MPSLLTLCALAGLLGACDHAEHLQPPVSDPPPQPSAQSLLCTRTRGAWHTNLRVCACPAGSLFSLGRGCMTAPPLPQLRGQVRISCGGHAACEAMAQDARLRAQVLDGIAVEPPRRSFEAMVSLQAWSPRATDAELRQITERPADDMLVRYALPALLGEGLEPDAADTACRQLITTQWPQAGAALHAPCAAMAAALKQVRDPERSVALVEKTVGTGRHAIRYAVANLGEAGGRGLYNLVGRGGHYYTRTLEVSDRRHLILSLVLSPQGHVMGGQLVRHTPLPRHAEHLLQRDTLYFDHQFAPMAVETLDLAPRAALSAAVGDSLRHGLRGSAAERLPTDGAQPPLWQALRALVMESAVDPRVAGLWQRMDVRLQPAQAFAAQQVLHSPLFAWNTDPVEAALQIAVDAGGNHGTVVAALLAADLPNLKISLMTGARNDWAADPAEAQALLRKKLATDAPQVVNISRGYEFALADCAAVFGPVLQATESTILFVAAAGNADARNAPHVCPASLASRHPNLIAVAGVHADGTLGHDPRTREPTSNYGDTVQIAAEVCAEAEISGSEGPSRQRECGTSVAAPRVANAALRILARRPDLRPSEVKQLLMDTCDASGLDVGCGGQLDTEAIEDWLQRHPTPLDQASGRRS